MSEEMVVKTKEIEEMGINAAILIGALRVHCNSDTFTRATVSDVEEWSGLTRNKQTAALKVLSDKGKIDVLQIGLPKSRHIRLLTE